MRRLEPALAPDDAFSRERGRQLAEAGRLFDDSGGREVAEFVQFVERHTVRDADTAAVVRVMTVHKAKGLGFDLVVLPDLEGTKLASRRRGLAVQRAPDRSVEWVLDLPPETFHAEDKVLGAHVAAAEADACYEELAVLYVAMTRAKRALYVITEPVGTSQSGNFTRLLQETLGETWSAGEETWFEAITPPAPASPADGGLRPVPGMALPRRPAHTPSTAQPREVAGERLFSLDDGGAAEFGRAVHALLAQVEWGGQADIAQWEAQWGSGMAETEALRCLRAKALAAVWAGPDSARGTREVWRERAFEIVLDGAWITGIFDRVVIQRGPSGQPEQAVVYDFKTDRGVEADPAGSALRHEAQLALYRRVAAVLTGLPLESVSAEVVFTASAMRVPLGSGA